MKMSPEDIKVHAKSIASVLRQHFRWIPDVKTTSPAVVTTNLGNLSFYGSTKMTTVAELGPADITSAQPHAYHLHGVSHVPTSLQKVTALELLVKQLALELGAPKDAMIDKFDPVSMTIRPSEALGRTAGQDASITDPYKVITEPLSLVVFWPVSPGTKIGSTRTVIS